MATYRAVNSLSTVDAAYLAGLVDGEGTITLSRKHAREKRQLVVSISSTTSFSSASARERSRRKDERNPITHPGSRTRFGTAKR
jgi:hypothetical protein